ncbi:DUF3152 domain-containing protein [Streptomyces sp. SHP 1-2]|uniref:DUF3152 domain-containing protein n=1 Tax=Streptomyces sp. SHP 1-2 TaxID=2769489 RepID=UPI002238AC1F|nr:DUF3152 domain-containing protein [Streptomyces sp. SHP 1-2]MCW5250571.1 DUF3152 domain-containing protein [Streptomyces sp. SHP 1-2]
MSPHRGRPPVTARTAGAVVLAGAALLYWNGTRTPGAADPPDRSGTPAAGGTASPGGPSPAAVPPGPAPAPASPAAPPPSPGAIPATGPGTFVTAKADGRVVGHGGRVRRYMVVVENGIDLNPEKAAAEIAAVLADPRGWTRDGTESFRLAGSEPYDFVVRIATPGTVDAICGRAGLDTRGEVNCSVGSDVVVNLKRWKLGSPEFDGPIGEYRALIVNHEVGHRIGRGHETCPGPGRPAPVMMQQIKGLKGCVANAWPHDRAGTYLGGPPVP